MSAPAFTCRVESETPTHSMLRIFVNGASAGLLTLRNEEVSALRVRLGPELYEALRVVMAALAALGYLPEHNGSSVYARAWGYP